MAVTASQHAAFTGASAFAQDSAADRAALLKYLEKTRAELVNATKGLSTEQWNFKPAADRWSVAEIAEHLLEKHYRQAGRSVRFCHPRDILQQVKNLCDFHGLKYELNEMAVDVAAFNYFAGL